jgi:hypothetical protein
VSWKYLEPNIQTIEHIHFFHSVDRSGRAMKYCAPVGGHFHEIKVHWDKPQIRKELVNPDGTKRIYEGPQFECGPPLTMQSVRLGRSKRMIKKPVRTKWAMINNDGDEAFIEDNHTHFVEYIGTDIISEASQREAQASDRAKIQPMITSTQISAQSQAIQKLQQGTYSNSQTKAD